MVATRDCNGLSDLLDVFNSTDYELRDVLNCLIENRELSRDDELEQLECRARKVLESIERIKQQLALVEELSCFKDILALHEKMLPHDDKSNH